MASAAKRMPFTGGGISESLKEKQARYRKEREKRKSDVGPAHNALNVLIGKHCNFTEEEVEDFILDTPEQVGIMTSFAKANGRRSLIVFHQEGPSPKIESGRTVLKLGTMRKVFVTEGTNENATGEILVFIKPVREKSLTARSLSEDVIFTYFDLRKGDGILAKLSAVMSQLNVPWLFSFDDWGSLVKTEQGKKSRVEFLGCFESFTSYLESAQSNIDGAVVLKDVVNVNLHLIKNAADCSEAAKNAELVMKVEELVLGWNKQIEIVLNQSQQIRKESGEAGPLAELDHWRYVNSRFNSLLVCTKSQRCRAAINTLKAARSKVIKTWREMDSQITDYANEAKDNVKYLYSLEKECIRLNSADPLGMIELIPGLMNIIKLIHDVSTFYNTPQRITSLFVKITNKMVIGCRRYVSENGTLGVWDQEPVDVLKKIGHCKGLLKEYKSEYALMKADLDPVKAAEFSEMSIFGKFETFNKRLNKIEDLLLTLEKYQRLGQANIEGMDVLMAKLNVFHVNLKKKKYDLLDFRKLEFDDDYAAFKWNMCDLENMLRNFLDNSFRKMKTASQSILLLKEFENFKIPCLQAVISDKYDTVLQAYAEEMKEIKKTYLRCKDEPPLPKDMPPVGGKILWSRQLFRKIRDPMEYLLKFSPRVLKDREGKQVCRTYNALGKVLMEFEVLYYRAWLKETENIKNCLQATLLVRHPETNEILINLDPQIKEMAREASVLLKQGFDIPKPTVDLLRRNGVLKSCQNRLTTILGEYLDLRDNMPRCFYPMLKEQVKQIERAVSHGMIFATWTSLNHDTYFNAVDRQIAMLKTNLQNVCDLRDIRIIKALDEIVDYNIIDMNSDQHYPVPQYLAMIKKLTDKMGAFFSSKSIYLENSTKDLVDMLCKISGRGGMQASDSGEESETGSKGEEEQEGGEALPEEGEGAEEEENEDEQFVQDCKEMIDFFKNKTYEAIMKCIKISLENFKKRVFYVSKSPYANQEGAKSSMSPLLEIDIVLDIPNITAKPSIEEIQTAINECARMIVGTSRCVGLWGEEEEQKALAKKEAQALGSKDSKATGISSSVSSRSVKPAYQQRAPQNLYKTTVEHKDVAKVLMMMGSAMNSIREPVQKEMDNFLKFRLVWETDRDKAMAEFVKRKPLILDYRAEILHYEKLWAEVEQIPAYWPVGPLNLSTKFVKSTLGVEMKLWKNILCKFLNREYREYMMEIQDFLQEYVKKLQRPVVDLDDIREMMKGLEYIKSVYITYEFKLDPIEEAYNLLAKFDVDIPDDESMLVTSLRYDWDKVISLASEITDLLIKIQPKFRKDLVDKIAQFKHDVVKFEYEYDNNGPMVEGIPPQEASDRLQVFQSEFSELGRKQIIYGEGEELFGLEISHYPMVNRVRKELVLLQKLYGLYNLVIKSINGYFDTPWQEVEIEKINVEILDFQGRCKRLPKGLKEWEAFNVLNNKINDFNETIPLLEMMSNPSMKRRHWDRMEKLCDHTFDVANEDFLLRDVMEAPLLPNKDDIEDICISSVKEKDIESKLAVVVGEWTGHMLTFSTFKTRGELLLKAADAMELITFLEDSLMILSSLLGNRYNLPFKAEIQSWTNKLTSTNDIIENWLVVQNLWVYLEAVFVGGDIAKQLPQEAKRFVNIDKTWQRIMARAHEQPNVVQCCTSDETMSQLLPSLFEQLELCQKSLAGYLEQKRLLFPRFFFISDPSLLEILGQASDSHSIQAHLLGIFENVYHVRFDEKDYDKILGVISREGEAIPLLKPVMGKGNVETWIKELLVEQQKALNYVICDGATQLQDKEFELDGYIETAPAQVGLLALQMSWTKDAEEALEAARFDKKIMANTNMKFLNLLNDLIGTTTKELAKFERIKYETFITIHVHQRDIFNELVKLKIKVLDDFMWLMQARFYYDIDNEECIVKITDVTFLYQNEFLGCTDRLVITPLTDRCYITIAQSIYMHMGAAPAGPAGTGKTETTKDMGKALGKYVVVFNCSDQMDFRGLGRIYKGLAQSGSWGCFDEFNRIDLPVLSVAAQQIYIVLQAKKDHLPMFIFTDGDNVSLNPEFGLFITMNPGYAGRQELPENLKVQFRYVAMMVPDRQIIMQVKLASCGFVENSILAQKFFTLYKLCEEQLTKQVHYDFGLRNILSVLRTLGAAKRQRVGESESTIVMRVLRDMNLSKLVDEDEPLFLSLISDLFPGIVLDSATYVDLQAAIETHVHQMSLVNHPPWNLKVVQLFETQAVRHGMMALGPSGAGKTQCINLLLRAMTTCGRPHKEVRMNPKAITAPQMFGRLDVATNDWTDGIFSTLWRRCHKVKKGDNLWIVLDGPVDAIWIENLNSVLDDNKTLTLANGDRIPMAPNSKICFEPHNIDNASPATVSRNGMVFMSSSGLNWIPILDGWLMQRPPTEVDQIRDLFHLVFEDLYTFAMQNCEPKMELLECNYIVQALNVLSGSIPPKEETNEFIITHIEHLFIFSLMWSVGALLELDDRYKVQQFLLGHRSKLAYPKIPPGSQRTIFEFVPNVDGTWDHWSERLVEYIYPSDHVPEYSSILVPNVDNVRTRHLIDVIAKQGKAVLLIGEQGTGKTVVVQGYMNEYNPDEMMQKSLNFSSATEPGMFQMTIESYVDKRVGTTYGPPSGRKMTVFIDDINMPVINEWGDQITNEIVRQQMEARGMFSLEKPGDFNSIVDIQFIAAMIHPGGGRNDIPERLKRQFNVFNCTLPSNASIDKIFGVIGEGYFCEERGFLEPVCQFVPKLVPITRLLWQCTKGKLLATPAKFHYIFNLRDLSRIWQGILNVDTEIGCSEEEMLRLFKHECFRVIADRFVNSEDKEWFDAQITRIVREHLGEFYADMIDGVEDYFVDFLRLPLEPDEEAEEEQDPDDLLQKIYERIPPYQEFSQFLQDALFNYNESGKGSAMDLVFFKDAMTHLVKISRVIRIPRGSALLVGVGGSGKQSLTKLATYIAGYEHYQITLSRSYNATNLMEDLKFLYRKAGQDGIGMSFIFTDNEIKEEGFLEYLNNILATGQVSGLFARDEIDEICNELIAVMKKKKPHIEPTLENLYEYFISRARDNLHIVLCFSPIGEKFRTRALKFPGLFSGCTMDWFTKWPHDALVAVSNYFVGNYKVVCTDEVKSNLVYTMGTFHSQVSATCVEYFERFRRSTHVTPKSYLSFLDGYKTVYEQKHRGLEGLAARMDTGLEKLLEAGESVAVLSVELVQKEKDLAIANVKADEVLKEVTASAAAAQKIKEGVLVVKTKAQGIVDTIAVEKAAAMEKLEAAEPALLAAEEALNTIKAADIATVRKLAKPPHLIMRIMDCVVLLFQSKIGKVEPDPEKVGLHKPSWSDSLKVMSSSSFLFNLKNFDKDTINEETIELVQVYFESDDYCFTSAQKVCGNVAGLLSWTLAMKDFFFINREVLPLKANLAKQEAKLAGAMKDLGQAQQLLDEKQAELDVQQRIFDAAMAEKQALLDDADLCRKKMTLATTLIDGLSGEKVRWTAQSKQFRHEILSLVGDSLLATGFLSYCGPFNQEFRNYLIKDQWQAELLAKGVPFTNNLNLINMLSDTTTIGEWNLEGLPGDDLSVQNGIIVTKSSRYPLLIDPQGQGKSWILNRETKNNMIITQLNHKWFKTHLEDSLSQGRPLLIQDVGEEIDPALDNVLEKNFQKSGKSGLKVKIGDKDCDLMLGFSLYITTKLPNPSYTPEVSAKSAIIDFTVTMQGLEDQLLGRVIMTEKQELEAEKVKLMEEVTWYRRKQKELEDNLLYKLTSTKGSLVDDVSLIEMLATTKTTANEVSEKLQVAGDTEIKIDLAREEFRPVAVRGSILYFLIVEMSMVNVMYQTSLVQFLELFDKSMSTSPKSPITSKRINNIISALTWIVFRYTARSLFEEHKLLFTLLVALKVDMRKGEVKPDEFKVFIKGGAALDLNSVQPKPCKWILDLTWLNLVELQRLPQFREILNQIPRNDKQWRNWFDTEAPEVEVIPDGYHTSLDVFRRLLLIRSWCIDRVLPQARAYIAHSLGKRFAEPVILNLEEVWAESNIRVPMICFLSQGADPTEMICNLAKKKGLECAAISMGQGQEVHARRLIQVHSAGGGWVLCQNCHLGLNFMDEMLDTVLTTEAELVHPNFRLWVTAEEHPKFPILLLQSSIKFTNDPPQGVRAGLLRTFQGITQDQIDITNMPQWKPMLFAIGFLHTVVQERRKFGPLGWNIPYEFNSSDHYAMVLFIQNHLDDIDPKKGVQWMTVRYMIGEVQYGGRVTDDYDKRLLNTFAIQWFSDNLFKPGYTFFGDYRIPTYKTQKEVLDAIEALPETDTPQVFGLHKNAEITYQGNTANTILSKILAIQPKDSGGGGGETRETVVYRMADEMLPKVPKDFIPYEVKARLIKMGILNSLNIFLKQEIQRMQKVIHLVRSTLIDLKLAIEGTIIMNEALREALDSLYDAYVPSKWIAISWPSATIGFWFTELIERTAQLSDWVFTGRPVTFWMTGFFNCQGFLTAMRQEVTRMHKGWALDTVALHNDVLKVNKEDIVSPPAEGLYVYGLFLDGAAWERRTAKLIESTPKVLTVSLPVVHVYAINSTAPKDPALYQCPVYKKPQRTDLTFITPLWLKTREKPNFWILRGVALLCDNK